MEENLKKKKKEWDEFFENSGFRLVAKKVAAAYKFWVIIGSLGIISWIIFSIGILYLLSMGGLNGLVRSDFNATINNNVENSYGFAPKTENFYTFEPNYTIINDIEVICPCNLT